MKSFVYELIVGDVYPLAKNEIFHQREKKSQFKTQSKTTLSDLRRLRKNVFLLRLKRRYNQSESEI